MTESGVLEECPTNALPPASRSVDQPIHPTRFGGLCETPVDIASLGPTKTCHTEPQENWKNCEKRGCISRRIGDT